MSRRDHRPGRPPGFSYRKVIGGKLRSSAVAVLHCDGISVEGLARRFGTPLYVYSASSIRRRAKEFSRAFGVRHTICYSVKANFNLSILRLLAKAGCGFDVVSGGELERVLRASQKAASKVVFSGVGKTREEMLAALKADILLFNLESEPELSLLAECASGNGKPARIAFRVNPDVPADTHPYISTGLRQHKFGVPIREARKLYATAARHKHLEVAGISVHIGSQITELASFAAAMERVAELVKQLREDGHRIQYVDAGGGLGIPYEDDASLPKFSEFVAGYAAAVLRPLRGLKVQVLLEPGRAIVGPAGALLTRVLYKKSNDSKEFLVVDAAMNDFLRPSLYGAYHQIVTTRIETRLLERVDIVGPICETGDFFARDREMLRSREGDLLAILDAGAYGSVLASNYNTRPRPAEVLVDGKSVKLIRRRETMADLLRQEV